jgi:hypothetical protein
MREDAWHGCYLIKTADMGRLERHAGCGAIPTDGLRVQADSDSDSGAGINWSERNRSTRYVQQGLDKLRISSGEEDEAEGEGSSDNQSD